MWEDSQTPPRALFEGSKGSQMTVAGLVVASAKCTAKWPRPSGRGPACRWHPAPTPRCPIGCSPWQACPLAAPWPCAAPAWRPGKGRTRQTPPGAARSRAAAPHWPPLQCTLVPGLQARRNQGLTPRPPMQVRTLCWAMGGDCHTVTRKSWGRPCNPCGWSVLGEQPAFLPNLAHQAAGPSSGSRPPCTGAP